MPSDLRLTVITGAAGGVGRATAERFQAAGRRVFLIDRDRDALGEVANALEAPSYVADLRTVAGCGDAAAATLAQGEVGVLVNNCAIAPAGDILETEPHDWDEVFAVNVRAGYLLARALLPSLLGAGGAAIVNVASVAGVVAEERHLAYCASKAAVINFSRALALDLARRGVRVNCVCPGSIDTPLLSAFYDQFPDPAAMRAADIAACPMRRLATASDVANAIFFLASEEAAFITGTTLVVDGGFSAR